MTTILYKIKEKHDPEVDFIKWLQLLILSKAKGNLVPSSRREDVVFLGLHNVACRVRLWVFFCCSLYRLAFLVKYIFYHLKDER